MKYLLAILFSAFVLSNGIAQKAAFVLGHIDTLYSKILAEKRPQLFSKYIIMSPSLWWNNESLLQIQPAQPRPGTKVYIAVGKEGKMMENDARKLAKLLQKSRKFSSLLFEFLPEENHGTILHPAVARAFKWMKNN